MTSTLVTFIGGGGFESVERDTGLLWSTPNVKHYGSRTWASIWIPVRFDAGQTSYHSVCGLHAFVTMNCCNGQSTHRCISLAIRCGSARCKTDRHNTPTLNWMRCRYGFYTLSYSCPVTHVGSGLWGIHVELSIWILHSELFMSRYRYKSALWALHVELSIWILNSEFFMSKDRYWFCTRSSSYLGIDMGSRSSSCRGIDMN